MVVKEVTRAERDQLELERIYEAANRPLRLKPFKLLEDALILSTPDSLIFPGLTISDLGWLITYTRTHQPDSNDWSSLANSRLVPALLARARLDAACPSIMHVVGQLEQAGTRTFFCTYPSTNLPGYESSSRTSDLVLFASSDLSFDFLLDYLPDRRVSLAYAASWVSESQVDQLVQAARPDSRRYRTRWTKLLERVHHLNIGGDLIDAQSLAWITRFNLKHGLALPLHLQALQGQALVAVCQRLEAKLLNS